VRQDRARHHSEHAFERRFSSPRHNLSDRIEDDETDRTSDQEGDTPDDFYVESNSMTGVNPISHRRGPPRSEERTSRAT